MKNTKVLLQLVSKEAKSLKKYAYKKELKKLNFKNFSSSNIFKCIYGQMTGDCFSDRASELIYKCAARIYKSGEDEEKVSAGVTLNGKPPQKGRGFYSRNFWSPIEVFVDIDKNRKNGNNEMLIKFLKNEAKVLKFK